MGFHQISGNYLPNKDEKGLGIPKYLGMETFYKVTIHSRRFT
jgi:hypothetical protein